MGDGFQIIADVEVTEADAPGLAASVVGWLTAEGIINAEPTDCVLGAESGYAPGPHYAAAVDGPSEWLLELRANGVGVSTSRNVFAPLQGKVGPVVCPHCGWAAGLEDAATAQLGAQREPFRDAIKAWLAGGAGEVACPGAGRWPVSMTGAGSATGRSRTIMPSAAARSGQLAWTELMSREWQGAGRCRSEPQIVKMQRITAASVQRQQQLQRQIGPLARR